MASPMTRWLSFEKMRKKYMDSMPEQDLFLACKIKTQKEKEEKPTGMTKPTNKKELSKKPINRKRIHPDWMYPFLFL